MHDGVERLRQSSTDILELRKMASTGHTHLWILLSQSCLDMSEISDV